MTVRSASARSLVAVMCLLPLAAVASTGDSAPLTVDDVISLLEAGIGEPVILKHIAATRTMLEPTVESLLALKRAGASDSLLEALLEQRLGHDLDEAGIPLEPSGPFRIFFAESDSGERVLHLTNLDESGRRIGGEVERPVPRNVVAARAPIVDEPPAPAPYNPPVVVNVLPPAGPEYAEPYTQDITRGQYPGFYGFVPRHHRPRHVRSGYVVRHNPLLPSPPGSYSHFLTYHRGGHSVLHPARPLGTGRIPYTHATAAARNKARFGRR